MGILGRLSGNGSISASAHDRESVAEKIVARYRERRARGELRVDDRLFDELCQVLPREQAHEVFQRFGRRRSRSDPKAEYLLAAEIGVAMHDAEHYTQNFKPIMVPSKPEVPDRTPPSAANTYAKAVAGAHITDADENAVLFEDLFKDE